MIAETDRLFLREMTQNDFNSLYKVLGDGSIMQYYPYAFDNAKVSEWIEKNIERYKSFGFGLWAVCLKINGEMIGDCGLTLQNINGVLLPEIGYHIRQDKQRQGYAKEAAAAVRDWAFFNTGFNEIYSYMQSGNIPSVCTALAYGCSKAFDYTVKNETVSVYSITREKWKELYQK